jgi:DNA invertase Pin-like site-specific DNA recombinase
VLSPNSAIGITVGLLACLADYERELISERDKAALKAAKARGAVLGNPNLTLVRNTDTTAATEARVITAKIRNSELCQVISEIRDSASKELTLREVTEQLNEAGYTNSRGTKFHATIANRVLAA